MDIGGTRQLLGAAGQVGVAHFLYVSIVGVRHARVPYSRLKAAAEDLVRQSGVPHSIVPSTQFYWLLDRMLGKMARLRVWPLPTKLPMQPADEGDFAAYVAGCVADGPGGDRQPFGGPDSAGRSVPITYEDRLVVPDTLGTTIKLSFLEGPARFVPTDYSQGGRCSHLYRAGRRDVPQDPLAPGFWLSGPIPSRYSQSRAGRSATECERGQGLSALAGTPNDALMFVNAFSGFRL